jgi:hypothetical protein
MARLSMVARRRFHSDEADRTSEALRSAMRQITVIMLISDIPIVANMLMTDEVTVEVVLSVLVVLNVLLTVLSVDDNNCSSSKFHLP